MSEGTSINARSAARCRAAAPLTLTVRLYPQVHALLVEEFKRVGSRLRAARAAHLMTVGLLQERAHFHPGTRAVAAGIASMAVARETEASEVALTPEDQAYVLAILQPAGD